MLEVLVSLVLVLSAPAQTAFEVPKASVLRDTSAA